MGTTFVTYLISKSVSQTGGRGVSTLLGGVSSQHGAKFVLIKLFLFHI